MKHLLVLRTCVSLQALRSRTPFGSLLDSSFRIARLFFVARQKDTRRYVETDRSTKLNGRMPKILIRFVDQNE